MMRDGHDDEVFTVMAKNDSKRESLHPALAMNSVDHRKPFRLARDPFQGVENRIGKADRDVVASLRIPIKGGVKICLGEPEKEKIGHQPPPPFPPPLP